MKLSIGKVLLVVLAVSFLYSIPFWSAIGNTASNLFEHLQNNKALIYAALLSACMVLIGHGVRAVRSRLLFSKAAETKVGVQFSAFAIGTLCNAVFPLRIGELFRSDVLAQRYQVSFLFSLILVCIERLFDIVLLSILCLCTIGFNTPLAIVGAAISIVLYLLWKPPRWFKRSVAFFAGFTNSKIEAKLLFSFWSLEYGLKRTLKPDLLIKFLFLSILNWVIYIIALFPLISSFLGLSIEVLSASVAAFVALSTSISPGALGSFTPTLESFGFTDTVGFILTWITAIVPISLIGLIAAFFLGRKLPLFRSREGKSSLESHANKLRRDEDISLSQLGFMRDYYSGKETIAEIAQNEMLGHTPAMGKYFTAGGSAAVTYLSVQDGRRLVTKTIPKENSTALRSQYAWLDKHRSPYVAEALQEHDGNTYYSIDIVFEQDSLNGYEYIHSHTAQENEKMLESIVDFLDKQVWGQEEKYAVPNDSLERVNSYIDFNIKESLRIAQVKKPSLGALYASKKILIHGKEYPNVRELLDKIMNKKEIMVDLANFRICEDIHGDLICDNLLWSLSGDHPMLLDPNTCNNFFDGPVFDFGKLSQSFQIGYEFLLRDTSDAESTMKGKGFCDIQFNDLRSAAYEKAWTFIKDELAPKYLTESEQRTMLFIGATNYLRRMKHQAAQFPENAAKFYAMGVKFLYEYYKQFD